MLRTQLGAPLFPVDQAWYEAAVAHTRAILGETVFWSGVGRRSGDDARPGHRLGANGRGYDQDQRQALMSATRRDAETALRCRKRNGRSQTPRGDAWLLCRLTKVFGTAHDEAIIASIAAFRRSKELGSGGARGASLALPGYESCRVISVVRQDTIYSGPDHRSHHCSEETTVSGSTSVPARRWQRLLEERVDEAVAALSAVPGVRGLVLGGSVGRGEPWPLSDIRPAADLSQWRGYDSGDRAPARGTDGLVGGVGTRPDA